MNNTVWECWVHGDAKSFRKLVTKDEVTKWVILMLYLDPGTHIHIVAHHRSEYQTN